MRAPIILALTLLLSGSPAALADPAATSEAYARSAAPQLAATPAVDGMSVTSTR